MDHLNVYASNVYSQYGEDGMISEILRRIGIDGGVAVEFGCSDGVACSNTANLWKNSNQKWAALLIDVDHNYILELQKNLEGTLADYKIAEVTPGTVDSLINSASVEVMSIDIDGDDFWVFCAMKCRAKVLIIEYNKTIPPHLDLVPQLGEKLGIGSRTLVSAAEQRGYTFLGLTEGNCIFVDTSYAHLFDDIEKDLTVLQPPEDFMYLATDFSGKVVPLGNNPPWGLAWPQSSTKFTPNQDNLLIINPVDPTERLINAVEALAFVPQQIVEIRSNAMQIALDMRGGYNQALRARIEAELGLPPSVQ